MDWVSAVAALDTAVATAFDGQTFRMMPRKGGLGVNDGTMPDSGRAEFDFRGSLELSPDILPAAQRNMGDPSTQRQPVSHEAVLTAHTAAWPYMPVRRDHIALGSVVYQIDDMHLDGTKRAVLYLNRA